MVQHVYVLLNDDCPLVTGINDLDDHYHEYHGVFEACLVEIADRS